MPKPWRPQATTSCARSSAVWAGVAHAASHDGEHRRIGLYCPQIGEVAAADRGEDQAGGAQHPGGAHGGGLGVTMILVLCESRVVCEACLLFSNAPD